MKKKVSLIIVVNSVSRKYYTADTSWLWDISFEKLSSGNIKNIWLGGCCAFDVAARLEAAGVGGKISCIEPDLKELAGAVKNSDTADIFALTCLSDRAGLIDAFKEEK